MSVPAPHFLLFSESRLKRKDVEQETEPESVQSVGHWRFVLESLDGEEKLEADDEEPLENVALTLRVRNSGLRDSADPAPADLSRSERATMGERLELLAVVRGLEALDQPSRVTLVTPSKYASRGLRFGLAEWRESGWLWERFGEMTPVKNHDLWQRVGRALEYHQVECRAWHYEPAEELVESESSQPEPAVSARQGQTSWASGLPGFCRRLLGKLRRALQPLPAAKGMADAQLA